MAITGLLDARAARSKMGWVSDAPPSVSTPRAALRVSVVQRGNELSKIIRDARCTGGRPSRAAPDRPIGDVASPAGQPSIQNDSGQPQGLPAHAAAVWGWRIANSLGDLTMNQRIVEVGQSWTSDIIGVGMGLGLYSVLFSLVTFLCLYVPA
jgi:hypothetical protein